MLVKAIGILERKNTQKNCQISQKRLKNQMKISCGKF